MELKVGMYVRTKKGIIFKYYPCKNTEYDKENNIYHEWDDWGEYDDYYIITKASENIIDLIEVGDYVNGLRINSITEVDKNNDVRLVWHLNTYGDDDISFSNEEIKSIVTKEAFKANEYRVETN